MENFNLLWNKETLYKIIAQENSIKKSFLSLLYSTLFSIAMFAISFFFFKEKGTDALFGISINMYFILLPVYYWIYSIILSTNISSILLTRFNLTPVSQDAKADLLVIVNQLQGYSLIIISFIFGIVQYVTYINNEGAIISIFLLVMIIFAVINLILYFMSLRMQVYAIMKLYNVEVSKAIHVVLTANVITYIIFSFMSFIIQFFITFFQIVSTVSSL